MNNKPQQSDQSTPVAIIGIGCLFPEAPNLKEFWKLLFHKRDAVTDIPPTHWSVDDYFDKDPKTPDHVYCKRGAFLPAIDFDPSEFGIPPSSLEATDTSQLLALVVAKSALEDAGYGQGTDFKRDKTSVILGVTGTQELVIPLGSRLGHPKWRQALKESCVPEHVAEEVIKNISASYVPWQENSFPGLLGNVVAGRICNRLNLGGTNCVVDAACASSFGALHLSLMELQSGKSDMIITGGVDTINDIFMHMCFSKTLILSPTGDIRPFSKEADGTVLGEGIGMMVLKRLADAENDGDRIYAVIKGIGTSSDGKAQSIYAPSVDGQIKALRQAYGNAQIDPATVALVEAHGTGTRVGDNVEFAALKKVFEQNTAAVMDCALGSVKSMIGHTKAAAGSAGIIKSALALNHKVLPPTLKAEVPDPELNIHDSPFYLNTENRPWISRTDHPRRAGVSSFGFGGSNFHVVLEEHDNNKKQISWDGSVEILALSAGDRQDLVRQISDLKEAIGEKLPIAKQARLTGQTRLQFDSNRPYRLTLVHDQSQKTHPHAESLRQLLDTALSELKAHHGETTWHRPNVYFSKHQPPGKMAFVFPGQGSQYIGMGLDLSCTFPELLHLLEQMNQRHCPVTNHVFPIPAWNHEDKHQLAKNLSRTEIAQPAIGAVSLGMYQVMTRFGVQPAATCGHSFGELTALCAAGWIDPETFIDLAIVRGNAMAAACETFDNGVMLAVKAPLKFLTAFADKSPNLVLANLNSPHQGVLSGPEDAIIQAQKTLKQKGFQSVMLPVSAAFHSAAIENAQTPFERAVRQSRLKPASIPVYANTTGNPYPNDAEAAKSILSRQLVHPVHFMTQIENLYTKEDIRVFIEVGPRSVLTGLIDSILENRDHVALSIDASAGKAFGVADLARMFAHLAALGYPVKLDRWEDPVPEKVVTRMKIPIQGANYRNIIEKETKTHMKTGLHQNLEEINDTYNVSNTNQYIKQDDMKTDKTTHSSKVIIENAFKTVQEGLKCMHALQAQTAEAHRKFLETQTEASRALQRILDNIQRLTGSSSGFENAHRQIMNTSKATANADLFPTESFDLNLPLNPVPENLSSIERACSPVEEDTPTSTIVTDETLENIDNKQSDYLQKMESTLLAVVSDLTGYPVEMLGMDMDIESDLGIDSIKRVEILSTLEEKLPGLSTVSPDIMGTLKTLGQICSYLSESPSTSAPMEQDIDKDMTIAVGPEMLEEKILEVVSNLTGYPIEMLGMDMDIESDLGIDSIKRVEILSTLEEKLPGLSTVSPDIMGTLKTLGQICSYLSQDNHQVADDRVTDSIQENGAPRVNPWSPLHDPPSPKASVFARELRRDKTAWSSARCEGRHHAETDDESIPLRTSTGFPAKADELHATAPTDLSPEMASDISRSIVTLKDTPFLRSGEVPIPYDRCIYIVSARSDLGRSICETFMSKKIAAVPVYPDDIPAILSGKRSISNAGGLIIIADFREDSDKPDDHTLSLQTFQLAKRFAPILMRASADGNALFTTVTRQDGAFGFKGKTIRNPSSGALAGLIKTAAIEWPGVMCHALDIAPGWTDTRAISQAVVQEFLSLAPSNQLEIGLDGEHRYLLELHPRPYPDHQTTQVNLGTDDVVIVSGGARGVTAVSAIELAEHCRSKMVLLGRSPAPYEEPDWLCDLTGESDIKRAILENEFNNNGASPKDIEKSYQAHMANREIRHTLEKMKTAGAMARYFTLDIRDLNQVASILEEVRRSLGPIRAVIHGAGVIADRLIVDKTLDQFQQVYSTKVTGLNALLHATQDDDLRYLVVFSSITARLGNKGQVDYAMANEALNKTARRVAYERRECHVTAINWGPWDGGMVSPALKREFQAQNVSLIPKKTGARCMLLEMSGDHGHPIEIVLGSPLIEKQKSGESKTEQPNPTDTRHEKSMTLTFKREIDTLTHPILESHILDGKPVVPLAIMAEWFGHGALHENPGLMLHGIDNMRILNGIKLDMEKKMIRLFAGKPNKKGSLFEVNVELRDGIVEKKDVVHSKAKAILTDTIPEPPVFNPSERTHPQDYGRSIEEIYDKILFHGNDLRGIREIIACASWGMTAKISTAPSPAQWIKEPLRTTWIGDPMVLDGAFQMASLWCFEETGSVSLPSYCKHYRQYRTNFPKDDVTVILQVNEVTRHKMIGDFILADSDDKVVAKLDGYEAVIDPSLNKAFKPHLF